MTETLIIIKKFQLNELNNQLQYANKQLIIQHIDLNVINNA